MRYYKIIHGYSPEDYISIDETELEKAYYCFLAKKDTIFSGGAIRGSEIKEIKPDYHKAMGWNIGYRLQAEDYEELHKKNLDRNHLTFLAEVRGKIKGVLASGKKSELAKLTAGI